MRNIIIISVIIFVVLVGYMFFTNRDVLNIASKGGRERRIAIVNDFQQNLLQLEDNYYELLKYLENFSTDEKEQLARLSTQIKDLKKIITELKQNEETARWDIIRQRFYTLYISSFNICRILMEKVESEKQIH